MERYGFMVAGLNFAVDLLLLLAVNKSAGRPRFWLRGAAASLLGGIFAALCLLPDFRFLKNGFWQVVCLASMCLLAFGLELSTLRSGGLFCFLWLILGGLAAGFGESNLWTGILLGALLALLYLTGFDKSGKDYVPVTICHGSKAVQLTALRDTGNLLHDPVTGKNVLIAGPDAARQLLDLTSSQLQNPVDTMTQSPHPGLRLIPYHSVGQPGGLLLAMHFPDVTVGHIKAPQVVAFAPHPLGDSSFQALAGGMA